MKFSIPDAPESTNGMASLGRREKGFTLTELLIALFIFSMLIGLAAYSFRFYISTINKVVLPYPKRAFIFSKLSDAIKSAFYYVAKKQNMMGKDRFFIFFEGTPDEMTFITAKPLMGYTLALCRLSTRGENMIWEESPVYAKDKDYKVPEISGDKKKLVLASGVTDFRLEYYRNGEKLPSEIRHEMPTLVAVHFRRRNRDLTYYYKIESDFSKKKVFTAYYYSPFQQPAGRR